MKFLFLCLVLVGCAGSKLTVQDKSDLAALKFELLQCDMAFKSDLPDSSDAVWRCKEDARRAWEAKEFDSGHD